MQIVLPFSQPLVCDTKTWKRWASMDLSENLISPDPNTTPNFTIFGPQRRELPLYERGKVLCQLRILAVCHSPCSHLIYKIQDYW